ncbi:hypothetical protein HK102_005563, partial [Quaeritorhiza haematococci]
MYSNAAMAQNHVHDLYSRGSRSQSPSVSSQTTWTDDASSAAGDDRPGAGYRRRQQYRAPSRSSASDPRDRSNTSTPVDPPKKDLRPRMILLSNLHPSVTIHTLSRFIKQLCPQLSMVSVDIPPEWAGSAKAMGFVEFANADDTQDALDVIDGFALMGRRLVAKFYPEPTPDVLAEIELRKTAKRSLARAGAAAANAESAKKNDPINSGRRGTSDPSLTNYDSDDDLLAAATRHHLNINSPAKSGAGAAPSMNPTMGQKELLATGFRRGSYAGSEQGNPHTQQHQRTLFINQTDGDDLLAGQRSSSQPGRNGDGTFLNQGAMNQGPGFYSHFPNENSSLQGKPVGDNVRAAGGTPIASLQHIRPKHPDVNAPQRQQWPMWNRPPSAPPAVGGRGWSASSEIADNDAHTATTRAPEPPSSIGSGAQGLQGDEKAVGGPTSSSRASLRSFMDTASTASSVVSDPNAGANTELNQIYDKKQSPANIFTSEAYHGWRRGSGDSSASTFESDFSSSVNDAGYRGGDVNREEYIEGGFSQGGGLGSQQQRQSAKTQWDPAPSAFGRRGSATSSFPSNNMRAPMPLHPLARDGRRMSHDSVQQLPSPTSAVGPGSRRVVRPDQERVPVTVEDFQTPPHSPLSPQKQSAGGGGLYDAAFEQMLRQSNFSANLMSHMDVAGSSAGGGSSGNAVTASHKMGSGSSHPMFGGPSSLSRTLPPPAPNTYTPTPPHSPFSQQQQLPPHQQPTSSQPKYQQQYQQRAVGGYHYQKRRSSDSFPHGSNKPTYPLAMVMDPVVGPGSRRQSVGQTYFTPPRSPVSASVGGGSAFVASQTGYGYQGVAPPGGYNQHAGFGGNGAYVASDGGYPWQGQGGGMEVGLNKKYNTAQVESAYSNVHAQHAQHGQHQIQQGGYPGYQQWRTSDLAGEYYYEVEYAGSRR